MNMILPQGDTIQDVNVFRRKNNNNGTCMGTFNLNPILDIRIDEM